MLELQGRPSVEGGVEYDGIKFEGHTFDLFKTVKGNSGVSYYPDPKDLSKRIDVVFGKDGSVTRLT